MLQPADSAAGRHHVPSHTMGRSPTCRPYWTHSRSRSCHISSAVIVSGLRPGNTRQLIERHGISLHAETVIHSDQGCHYTSLSIIVQDKGLRQTMSHKGNCWHNAPRESFVGHMKDKIAACSCYGDVKEFVDGYMDYHNNQRFQVTPGQTLEK